MKYIALLKSINVSGQKMIKMAELKVAFESLQFRNIQTYLQSGNVVFDYETTDIFDLTNVIEEKIKDVFGFEVSVIIRTYEELKSIVDNNPFLNENGIEHDKLHVTFLLEVPRQSILEQFEIKKDEMEQFRIISKEIYLYCPNGYGRTKLTNTTFEKKLKVIATTRNWNTVKKLVEIGSLK